MQVATYAQMPGATLERVGQHIGRHRGAPLDATELRALDERLETVRRWLPDWAPERIRFSVALEGLPEAAAQLTEQQRRYLETLADTVAGTVEWDGETLQSVIFEHARSRQLAPGKAFNAIYLAFVGKPSGPRAGALWASLDPQFVTDRLKVAAGAGEPAAT